MLSNLKKYNTEEYNRNIEEKDYILRNSLVEDYEYFTKEIKIGDEIIKKIFVVDIRTMSDELIKSLFDDFTEFQRVVLSDDFYMRGELEEKNLFTYSYYMDLVFLYDPNRKYYINKYYITRFDMQFALKHFMTEDELKLFLNRCYPTKNLNKEILVELKDKVVKLNHFNYIHGSNGSGKSVLLKEISGNLKVPTFSMDNTDLNLENYIINKDYVKKYLRQLTGLYDVSNYSDYEKYVHRMAQILEFSREHNNIVLLDDLRWDALDSRNKIDLIDTLFDYSLNNERVVITGCNQRANIKRMVYKSNIIDLDIHTTVDRNF